MPVDQHTIQCLWRVLKSVFWDKFWLFLNFGKKQAKIWEQFGNFFVSNSVENWLVLLIFRKIGQILNTYHRIEKHGNKCQNDEIPLIGVDDDCI